MTHPRRPGRHITWDRTGYYYARRVPKRFAHLDPRSQVRVCLWTRDPAEARRKAEQVGAQVEAQWHALAAGETGDAAARCAAARDLARSHGFDYVPLKALAEGALGPIVDRLRVLEAAEGPDGLPPRALADAILGLPEPAAPTRPLSAAFARFVELSPDLVAGKSERQVRAWHHPRRRAVENFIAAVADRELSEISRADAVAFRQWWQARIEAEELDPTTANKDFTHLAGIVDRINELDGLDLVTNPFRRLAFRVKDGRLKGKPFSVAWLRDRVLARGAFDGLNAEARDIFLLMVNTGARPSELCGLRREDIATEAAVPHIRVEPYKGRELKTTWSRRAIPLAGVSLEAARRLHAAGAPARYLLRAGAWSATVSKYLAENGLRETEDHTAYSLRHAFEDRLQEVCPDDRLRAELMGHKHSRPAYGAGGSLDLKARAIRAMAL